MFRNNGKAAPQGVEFADWGFVLNDLDEVALCDITMSRCAGDETPENCMEANR